MNINIIRRNTITDKAIYTHPKNFSVFKGLSGNICYDDNFIGYPLGGLPVYINDALPATQPTGKVIFPTDGNWRFCEFEEKDEEWALGLGFATRKEEPVYYMVDHSKMKVDWNGIDLKLDWSIDEKTEKIYKEYTKQMQDRIIREKCAKALSSSHTCIIGGAL